MASGDYRVERKERGRAEDGETVAKGDPRVSQIFLHDRLSNLPTRCAVKNFVKTFDQNAKRKRATDLLLDRSRAISRGSHTSTFQTTNVQANGNGYLAELRNLDLDTHTTTPSFVPLVAQLIRERRERSLVRLWEKKKFSIVSLDIDDNKRAEGKDCPFGTKTEIRNDRLHRLLFADRNQVAFLLIEVEKCIHFELKQGRDVEYYGYSNQCFPTRAIELLFEN